MPEYRDSTKDPGSIEAFEDPGPSFDPAAGPPPIWFQRVVENLPDLVIAFGHDGTVWYVNDAAVFLLGYDDGELLGTNALDLIAPEDLVEAAETIRFAAIVEGWRPPRPFRLVRKDGRLVTFDVEGMALYHVPEVQSIVCVARHAEAQAQVDRIIDILAAGRPLSEVLDQLVHLMHRPGWRLGVAIQYDRGDGTLAVAESGLAPELTGIDRDRPGSPWARARTTKELVIDVGLTTLGDDVRAAATTAGFQTCWAIVVPDPASALDACILVWNAEAVEPEVGQDKVFDRLRRLLELALDGRAQSDALLHAANTDALTGLENRRSFEEQVGRATGTHTAVLFADLDGFKQVNDELGHAAGDEVMRIVGQRLHAALRGADRAARLGGDEFAMLCQGVGEDEVVEIAQRLITAIGEPIHLDGDTVTVGVSIGIALDESDESDESDEPGADDPVRTTDDAPTVTELLQLADRQLYAAKSAGRNGYRLERWRPDPAAT